MKSRSAAIIDDDVDFCKLLETSLGRKKFKYTSINSFDEAIDYLGRGFDANVYIIDFCLPAAAG